MRLKRITFFTIIFVLLGISTFGFHQYYWIDDYRLFQKSSDKLREAEKSIEDEQYEEALQILDKLEAQYRDNDYVGYIQFNQGKSYYLQGDIEQAMEYLGYAKFGIENNESNKIHKKDRIIQEIEVYQAMSLSQLGEYKLSNDLFKSFQNKNIDTLSSIPGDKVQYQYALNKVSMSEYEGIEKLLNEIIQNTEDEELTSKSFDLLSDYYQNQVKDEDELFKHYHYAFQKTKDLKYLALILERYILEKDYDLVLQTVEENNLLFEANNPSTVPITTYKGVAEYNKKMNRESLNSLTRAEQLLTIHKDEENMDYYLDIIDIHSLYNYYELEVYEAALQVINSMEQRGTLESELQSILENYKVKIEMMTPENETYN